MASATIPTRPSGILKNLPHDNLTLERHVRVMVVSPQLEVRQPLIRTLEVLGTDVFACSTRTQAEEVLSRQGVEVVFCDEHLADGSYRDLINSTYGEHQVPRVVVTTRTGEWDLYLEALGRGAVDVIRFPWHPTDVELIIVRALRDEGRQSSSRAPVG